MWDKIKAICLRSLTMGWSYVLLIGGEIIANIDTVAALVTDKQVSAQIAAAIGSDPAVLGHWTALVGIITAAARARSIVLKKS
jgi:hypothetical protein